MIKMDENPWIILRTCLNRKDYVIKYLIPSILQQGLPQDHLLIWEDTYEDGNLTCFLRMMDWIDKNVQKDGYIWLIQDDIIVSSTFVERLRKFDREFKGIVCGYCCDSWNEEFLQKTGKQLNKNKWYSFPCERIPVNYTRDFLNWFDESVLKQGEQGDKYRLWVRLNKLDDSFWMSYIQQRHPDEQCWNVGEIIDGVPQGGLVEHVDYLLGGSRINIRHGDTRRLNYFWNQDQRTQAIEKEYGYDRKKMEVYYQQKERKWQQEQRKCGGGPPHP